MFKVRRESVLVLHLPTTVMMTTTIMEPVLIKPIKLTKYTKQADQPQHKHGLIDQINLGKVVRKIVGGNARTLRELNILSRFAVQP